MRTENQKCWRNLLIRLKSFLRRESKTIGFEIYKFLGDGWILLFAHDFEGSTLLKFMGSLSEEFRALYTRGVCPVLSTAIPIVGMTFGVDKGTLIYMTMNHQREYLGRALNVATRLQGSIKDGDPKPQYKVLMSRSVFAGFGKEIRSKIRKKYRVQNAKRKLRNISGGDEYLCKKITLFT